LGVFTLTKEIIMTIVIEVLKTCALFIMLVALWILGNVAFDNFYQ